METTVLVLFLSLESTEDDPPGNKTAKGDASTNETSLHGMSVDPLCSTGGMALSFVDDATDQARRLGLGCGRFADSRWSRCCIFSRRRGRRIRLGGITGWGWVTYRWVSGRRAGGRRIVCCLGTSRNGIELLRLRWCIRLRWYIRLRWCVDWG